MKKILMLALIGMIAMSSCKKSTTTPTGDNLLHIDVSKVVAPTTYNITLTKGGVTAFTVTGGTENKTYTMPATIGEKYDVTISIKSNGADAVGWVSFTYNSKNIGGVAGYGTATTNVVIQ